MSDAPWTPGPWTLRRGVQIAVTPDMNGLCGSPWCKYFWPSQAADARLIRAAPEMGDVLAMLETALNQAPPAIGPDYELMEKAGDLAVELLDQIRATA